jgi:hypothetical protein
MCYTCGGEEILQIREGEAHTILLPVSVGLFYGYSPKTDRILMASVFPTGGKGPTPASVSDLSILDPNTGAVQTVLPDSVVEAHWAPNGEDIAYILATDTTYELHWRYADGRDVKLASDVAFTWSVSPLGDAVAFTRQSRYGLNAAPGLYIVTIATGKEVKASDVDLAGYGGQADEPVWSPDGQQVALSSWGSPDGQRMVLAQANGSGSIDLKVDPALSGNWWASLALPSFLWDPDNEHWVGAPAVSQGGMGGPSPLVVYRLDRASGTVTEGKLLAEVNTLIGWDMPGRSVWIQPDQGNVQKVDLP